MACLDDLTISNLVGNNLPAADHVEVIAHLDGCRSCYELVADVLRNRAVHRLAPGTTVGRYVVERVVGAGAMGVVYAAHDPELDRKVALKLVKSDPDARSVERMRREAQAMAQLSHPNVVPIFDVGTFGDEVFLAMEYVAGRTLRAWLDEASRSQHEIVAAVVAAGRGLAAAHAVGIVHRDFKPDNVLVAETGRICVTDFGLARAAATTPAPGAAARAITAPGVAALGSIATAPGITSNTDAAASSVDVPALTRTGQLLGTPAYMAPEQLAGGAVDARADQFALCVVLHEALTGKRPFAGESLDELRAAIARGAPADDPRVPAWLARAIARGLAADPAARFGSTDALVDTLARDPSIRRRRIALLATAIAVALVVGFALPRGAAGDPCPDAGDRLAGAWDPALRARMQPAFLATHRPYAGAMFETTAAALDGYARAWTRVRGELCRATYVHRDQSEARYDAELACLDRRRVELAGVVQLLVDAPDDALVQKAPALAPSVAALASCRDGEALAERTPLPANPADRAGITAAEQTVATAAALTKAGKITAAMKLVDDVVPRARTLGYAPTLAHALSAQGQLRAYASDPAGAEHALYEAADLAAKAKDDELVARAWIVLTYVAGSLEQHFDESASRGKMAWTAVQRAGARDPLVIEWHNAIGAVAVQAGKADDAIREFSAALALAEHAQPPDEATLTDELSKLAIGYVAAGRFADARGPLDRSLAIIEKTRGPEHPDLAFGLLQAAGLHYDAGSYADAQHAYGRALAIYTKLGEPESVKSSEAIEGLGNCALALGDYAQALTHHRHTLAIRDALMGPDDPHAADTHQNLAHDLLELGRIPEAKTEAERALAIYRKAYGEQHPMVATALRQLAMLETGTLDAVKHLEAAVAIATATLGPDHPEVGVELGNLGNAYVALRRFADARAPLERALAVNEKAYGPDHEFTALARVALAQLALERGDAPHAIPLLERAAASLAAGHALPKQLAMPHVLLAQALWEADRARSRAFAKQATGELAGAKDPSSVDLARQLAAWTAAHR